MRNVFQHVSKQLIVLHLSSHWQHKQEHTNYTVFTPELFCMESRGLLFSRSALRLREERGLAASCRAEHHMGVMPLHHHRDDVSLGVLTCLGQLCAVCVYGTRHAGWPWPRDLREACKPLLCWAMRSPLPAVQPPPPSPGVCRSLLTLFSSELCLLLFYHFVHN